MNTIAYITYHIQPLLGLALGIIVISVSGYLYWKIDKKVKLESTQPIKSRSMSHPIGKTISSLGIAFGGIMIIVAIKFLTS